MIGMPGTPIKDEVFSDVRVRGIGLAESRDRIMKISSSLEGETLRVEISGEVEVESCRCLRNFWELRVAGKRRVRLDLSDIDCADAEGTAELLRLIVDSARSGMMLEVEHAPQVLAHSLYRTADLTEPSNLSLVEPREEEPYA